MVKLQLRDGSIVVDRRMDLMENFDERSREFPVSLVVKAVSQDHPLISKIWLAPTCLDQKANGACGAFAMTHLLLNEPGIGDPKKYNETFARNLYFEAQKSDRFPGGEYPGADPISAGTSLLAVLRVAKKAGMIYSYNWAFRFQELLQGICYVGPAMVGTSWYSKMSEPDKHGVVRAGGDFLGRHAYIIYGINHRTKMLLCMNSWGLKFGVAGKFQMSFAAMEALLQEQGEAVFIRKAA